MKYPDDFINQIVIGDCIRVMKQIPDESIHCVITSPPYWGLRDYGTATWEGGDMSCDHIAPPTGGLTGSTLKGCTNRDGYSADGQYRDVCKKCNAIRIDEQLGLEKTPEEYIEKMVKVFREVKRILRKDGTVWLNMGDSYATHASKRSGQFGKEIKEGFDDIFTRNKPSATIIGLKEKDLCGIPWRLAFALQADGWYLRSDIIYSKPNPMPESVTDRPTKSHEYLFLLTKSSKYFYDADAIREGNDIYTRKAGGYKKHKEQMIDGYNPYKGKSGFADCDITTVGRNKRSVWEVTTEPYPRSHFATFPVKLIEPCVLTTPTKTCGICGAGWERVVETKGGTIGKGWHNHLNDKEKGMSQFGGGILQRKDKDGLTYQRKTIGFRPTCKCNSKKTGRAVILDMFAGSSTTGMVAKKHSRDFIMIELNPAYKEMSLERLSQEILL